ncbi:lipopolysaccharide heptosyltransferase II [bacterium B17]|nr:lipopolysaccharide heptosyltransferase II [bacterium B17]
MSEKILICSLNWLGDCIMSMPAIQVLRNQEPEAHISVLVKPKLVDLWEMHSAVDDILVLESGMAGALKAADELKVITPHKAFIFPQSFRSALVPALARVPKRRGQVGHNRSWMLTSVVKGVDEYSSRHQAWEYVDVLDLEVGIEGLPLPALSVPEITDSGLLEVLDAEKGRTIIGLFPSAARGPSKCWPMEHFIETAKMLVKKDDCRVIVFGSPGEKERCDEIAGCIGDYAVSLAGKTSLKQLAGALKCCQAVLCNDSGGMHLAAAVGAGVVAVYGMTDPVKTGPWGKNHKIVQKYDVPKARDIGRNVPEAIEILRSIKPKLAYDAIKDLLK